MGNVSEVGQAANSMRFAPAGVASFEAWAVVYRAPTCKPHHAGCFSMLSKSLSIQMSTTQMDKAKIMFWWLPDRVGAGKGCTLSKHVLEAFDCLQDLVAHTLLLECFCETTQKRNGGQCLTQDSKKTDLTSVIWKDTLYL